MILLEGPSVGGLVDVEECIIWCIYLIIHFDFKVLVISRSLRCNDFSYLVLYLIGVVV